jgi:hypothetical protein
MYFATVAWLTSMPSLSNSPWIRSAPQSGFGSAHLPNQFTNFPIYRWSGKVRFALAKPARTAIFTLISGCGGRAVRRGTDAATAERRAGAAALLARLVKRRMGLLSPGVGSAVDRAQTRNRDHDSDNLPYHHHGSH